MRGSAVRRGTITGRDPYGLTAASLVAGATVAAQGGISRSGALAPSEAFTPGRFLESLRRFDLAWEVGEVRDPVRAGA